jgi:hypothetical protein
MMDREIETRSNLLSGQHAKHPTTDGLGQILKISIDGMDQAKFKVPRNLKSSSAWDKLWRPTLHVVGAIVYGYYETYCIMDSDQRKDSNMNMTIICILLNLLWDDFKDTPHHLPRNLAIGFDNTTRESKNQWFALFLAFLRTAQKFDGTGSQNLTTGHSHNRQDQRFSSAATLLSGAPVLEDPEEFADYIRTHLKPADGHKLKVFVLDQTLDFQSYFASFGIKISGLAATHTEPDTNHSWSFVSRETCRKMYGTDLEIQCMNPEWEKLEEHDQDTILLCKQFLHSSESSQAPLLMMPYSLVVDKTVPEMPLNPRNKLPMRSLHEFQKTAKAVGAAPWELVKAQAYLEEWIANNIKSDLPASTLDLGFFKHYRTFPPTFGLNGIQHAGIQFPAPIQLCVVCGDASPGGRPYGCPGFLAP